MLKIPKSLILPFSLSMLVCACSPQPKVEQAATELPQTAATVDVNQQLDEVVDQYTVTFMQQQPTLSSMLAVPKAQVGGSYNDRFPDYSVGGMQNLQANMQDAVAQIAKVPADKLDEQHWLHRGVLAEIFAYYAGMKDFSGGYIDTWGGHLPYIINQISGPLIDVPKLMQVQQTVTSEQDAEDYLTRLANFDKLVDQVLTKFIADKQAGIQLPAKLYPQTLTYFDNFLKSTPAQHALVTSFADKLQHNTALTEAQQQKLVADATALVDSIVYPAYQKARQILVVSQAEAAGDDGIWSQPGGDEFYNHAIRYLGDSSLSADEIHQIGLDEVQRISHEMDEILRANGYKQGSVGQRMLEVAELPEFLYEDSDQGRQALLDNLNIQVKAVMAKAPEFYNTIPSQKVEVKRIPAVSEAGEAGGFYTPPSLDGSRPGIYWINLRDMSAVPSFSLKTLTYHEAVPGHHFQIALNMAQQNIGLLRQNAPFNAYVEGWALYSELVAKEMGMYEGDPWGDLGRLQAELYRAVRLVVDTGLHRKKWSREQAIEYFHNTTGTSMTDVTAEVERYIAWPGQALGYKLGMLQFVELRNWAAQQLGDKFNLPEFHDLVLLPGARPMSLVRSDVESWVKQQLN